MSDLIIISTMKGLTWKQSLVQNMFMYLFIIHARATRIN